MMTTNNSPIDPERIFLEMLMESGVEPDWTWENTMRAVINHPNYRILPSATQRKDAFSKFSEFRKKRQQEERRLKIAQSRQEYEKLIREHPKLTPFTKWKKAEIFLKLEPSFEEFSDTRERHRIFEDIMKERRNEQKTAVAETRRTSMNKLAEVYRSLKEIDLSTRWIEAFEILQNSPDFKNDPDLMALEKVDLLIVYEDHIKQMERSFQDHQRSSSDELARQDRLNRDKFKALLESLVKEGKIHAKSKWCDLYRSEFKDRSEYLDMLGQQGSTPLDLFRDKVEALDDILYEQRKFIMDYMETKKLQFKFTPSTTFEEFSEMVATPVKSLLDSSKFTDKNVQLIFDKLRSIATSEQDPKKEEKKVKKAMKRFKIALKKLDLNPETTYDKELRELKKLPEFQELELEDDRRYVFDRFLSKLRKGEVSE